MSQDSNWQELLIKRRILRQEYFNTNNPNTVKKNLLYDLLVNIRECSFKDIKDLVELTFHPDGCNQPTSYGKNTFFNALLAISDQLFIYDEFIQELRFNLNQNLNLILPHIKLKKTFIDNSLDLSLLHDELKNKHKALKEEGFFSKIVKKMKKLEMLNFSPKKALLFNLINGTRTRYELWELFNKANNLEKPDIKIVSIEYVFQILNEMEDDGIISIKEIDKKKIVYKN